jgi:hypothetical protein
MKDSLRKAFEAGELFAHAQDSTEGLLGFDTEPDFETWYEQLMSEQLRKHSVVRGAVTSHCLSLKDECEFTNTCPECTEPATEQ